jgi:hypothetical protein
MWARPWPNGQGWDVGTNAEVVRLENGCVLPVSVQNLGTPHLSRVVGPRRCRRACRVGTPAVGRGKAAIAHFRFPSGSATSIWKCSR